MESTGHFTSHIIFLVGMYSCCSSRGNSTKNAAVFTLVLKCLRALTILSSLRGGGDGLNDGPRPRALTRLGGAGKGDRLITALLVTAAVGEACLLCCLLCCLCCFWGCWRLRFEFASEFLPRAVLLPPVDFFARDTGFWPLEAFLDPGCAASFGWIEY